MLPFAGEWTLDAFSRHLDGLDLFHGVEPTMPAYREYRRWAVESAAADLALRQAGTSLAEALGRTPEPITFVVSLRLGEPPSLEPVTPPPRGLPVPAVQARLVAGVGRRVRRRARRRPAPSSRSTSRAPTRGRSSTSRPTRRSTGASPRSCPEAWMEDPDLTVPEADAALEPHRDRITWDAPIHGVADIEKLAFLPRTINVKPSRIGTWRELLRTYEWCAERDITLLRRRAVRAGRRARADPVPRGASSTPTAPTTSRPPATTGRTSPRPGCRPARSRPTSSPPGSAGGS